MTGERLGRACSLSDIVGRRARHLV